MRTSWVVAGSRYLCKTIVKGDFDHARKLLEISPALISIRHPLGWAPLHVVILCGDSSLVKFVLGLPGLDITIADDSTFNTTSLAADILCRQDELCPNICGTESTSGATPLHFACMRGDWEILNLLLEMPVSFDVRDDLKRLPLAYLASDRVNLETLKAYETASKTWCQRWRFFEEKDIKVLCDAIWNGDYDYCKEILNTKPELAQCNHPFVLTALQAAVGKLKPVNVDSMLLQLNEENRFIPAPWTPPWGSPHRTPNPLHETPVWRSPLGSTPLHYACLLGDMKIVEVLLRNGAEWTISDAKNFLPEDYARINGDRKMQEFNRLCREMEELRLAGTFAKELELEVERGLEGEKKLENERELEGEVKPEGERKLEGDRKLEGEKELEGEELERLKKREELCKRHIEIENIIGDKLVGQRGPIRSIASAIRLRENGWVDPDRPLVMLFLGSSGIGKTELAKQIAYYLHGDASDDKTSLGQSLTEIEKSGAFVRIDMSEYQHDHTVSNLTGSPKGYVGYDEGGILTTKLKQNPEAIVLFDEIEKAHPDVLTVFLQLFDDGRITDPKFGTIHCERAVFIMTSNLGSEEIRAASQKLHELVDKTEDRYSEGIGQFIKQLYPLLKASFRRDEFLGRINRTVVFLPFNDKEIRQIIEIELRKWKKRAEEQHAIRLSWSPDVVDRLADGYDVNYGARSVINAAQTLAITKVAESQIRGDIKKNWLVHLFVNDAGSIDMAKQNAMGHILQRGCRYVF